MRREKSVNGYRTKIINVRLTEKEAEQLQSMFDAEKEAAGGSMLMADYMRRQLLHQNDDTRLKRITNELKQIRSELNQANKRMEKLGDESSYRYFVSLIERYKKVIEDKL